MNTILKFIKKHFLKILVGLAIVCLLMTRLLPSKPKRITGGPGGKTADLVLIYAPWCGHSKNMLEDYARVEKDYHGKNMNGHILNILKYSSEEDSEEVKKRNVKGFPTLFFEKDGRREQFPHRTYDKIVAGLQKLTS